MSSIYKYALQHGENILAIPSDSVPLSVAGQHNLVMMWVLHYRDPDSTRVYARKFHVVNTGEDFDIYANFIGTALTHDESIVKHVFEQLDVS